MAAAPGFGASAGFAYPGRRRPHEEKVAARYSLAAGPLTERVAPEAAAIMAAAECRARWALGLRADALRDFLAHRRGLGRKLSHAPISYFLRTLVCCRINVFAGTHVTFPLRQMARGSPVRAWSWIVSATASFIAFSAFTWMEWMLCFTPPVFLILSLPPRFWKRVSDQRPEVSLLLHEQLPEV